MIQVRISGKMIKTSGYINDAWSVFFREAFTPKTRALRKDIFVITWTPVILYYILTFLIKGIYQLPIFVTKKTSINVLDSTKSLNDLLNLINPIISTIASWAALVIGAYLVFCITSLITRRIHDMGASLKVSKFITLIPLLAGLYTQDVVIATFINHAQPFFNIQLKTLPYTGSIYTFSIVLITYLLLQIVPSNMFDPKYYLK